VTSSSLAAYAARNGDSFHSVRAAWCGLGRPNPRCKQWDVDHQWALPFLLCLNYKVLDSMIVRLLPLRTPSRIWRPKPGRSVEWASASLLWFGQRITSAHRWPAAFGGKAFGINLNTFFLFSVEHIVTNGRHLERHICGP